MIPRAKPTLTAEEIADLGEPDCCSHHREGWSRLLDEVGRTRALLRRIEWAASGDYGATEACPECRATREVGVPGEHKPGCELAGLLTSAAPT